MPPTAGFAYKLWMQDVQTPRFGACESSSSQRCVLHPSQCSSSNNEVYQPGRCNQVSSLGRCQSVQDDNRCAANAESCFYPRSFAVSDPSCGVQWGEGVFGQTIYGRCRTLPAFRSNDDQDRSRCVLSKSECTDQEDFLTATWVLDWKTYVACRCQDVPTGVCLASTPYCAIQEEDCVNGDSFLPAQHYSDPQQQRPPITCRLCTNPEYPSAACFTKTATRCVLESSDCQAHETFRANHPSCGVSQVTSGRCTSTLEDVDCAPNRESCWFADKYEASRHCSLQRHEISGVPTYFGSCGNKHPVTGGDWRDHRCVWGEDECDVATEVWRPARTPQSTWFEGCTCERVETGVCQLPDGSVHCAVSAQGCDDPATYVKAMDKEAKGIQLACRLCSHRNQYVREVPDLSGSSDDTDAEAFDTKKNEGSSSTPLVVGLTVSAVVVLLGVMFLLVRRIQRADKESMEDLDDSEDKPVDQAVKA